MGHGQLCSLLPLLGATDRLSSSMQCQRPNVKLPTYASNLIQGWARKECLLRKLSECGIWQMDCSYGFARKKTSGLITGGFLMATVLETITMPRRRANNTIPPLHRETVAAD